MSLDNVVLRRLVVANAAFLCVNLAVLAALAWRGAVSLSPQGLSTSAPDLAGTADGPPGSGASDAPPTTSEAPGRAEVPAGQGFSLDTFIRSLVDPLSVASADLRLNVVLPTDEQTADCIATDSLKSPACGTVLELLRKGHEQAGMPFPTLPVAPSGEDGPSSSPGSDANVPSRAWNGDAAVLEVYFTSVQARLREAAVKAGDDPATVLPSPAAVEAAIDSGDPRGATSATVIAQLREGYERYGLRFPEPGLAGAAATPTTPTSADETEESKLLTSYFDLVLRKLVQAARDQGRDPDTLKPSGEDVAAAVRSGRTDSEETIRVIARLRASYAELGLPFIEPGPVQ